MLKQLSNKIVLRMCEEEVIDKEEEEIYEYGLYSVMSTGSWLALALFLSLLFHELFVGIIFILTFKSLRKYAGGYHAKTPIGCFILSTLIYAIVLIGLKYITFDEKISCGLLISAALIIFVLSPVESINKPLDEIENIIYRHKTRIVLLIELLIALGSGLFHYKEIVNCIIMAQGVIALALIAGNISIYRHKLQ